MSMRKMIAAVSVAASATLPMAANAASIAINSVQQCWPWNNKVDITYTVTDGQNRAAGVYCGIEFNVSVPGHGAILLHGYSLGASAEGDANGKQHTVTWTAPSGLKSTEAIAKPPNISHAKFAKYAKFCFMDDFANLADFA